MKKICIALCVIAGMLPAVPSLYAEEWRLRKSTHFIIKYRNAPEDFIRRTQQHAEQYYNRIADDLGFTRYDFWLWDNRAAIYIYDSAEEYRAATGHPGWSGGAADSREKIIYTFVYAEGFMETILPHELGHIIFREFVGVFNPAVPLWLEEGVASYQEKGRYAAARGIIRHAMQQDRHVPLSELTGAGSFMLMDDRSALMFYSTAYTVIDYLMKEYGKDRFVYFCQNLRDKQNLDRAISSAYPLDGLAGLEEAWEKWIRR